MMEWILGNRIPNIDGASFQVWTDSGGTRTCRRYPARDQFSLWFTDCTHPAQNAYCAQDSIQAWRIKPE